MAKRDRLYNELVRVPFFVPFGRTGHPIHVHPLLQFPYYFGGVEKTELENTSRRFYSILKHLRVTTQYVFPYMRGRLDATHHHPSSVYSLLKAMPVGVPRGV